MNWRTAQSQPARDVRRHVPGVQRDPCCIHALAWLRDALQSELFIGGSGWHGAHALRRAESAGPIRAALDGAAGFGSAISSRSFVVALNNWAVLALAALITAAVASEAPGVSLDLRPSGWTAPSLTLQSAAWPPRANGSPACTCSGAALPPWCAAAAPRPGGRARWRSWAAPWCPWPPRRRASSAGR